ncbi:MAG TPA: hypothetical protein VKP65_04130 [Rhodothermales bacterium]|nr:hypothetical protein [Rhodothermales bacterium]
MVAGLAIALSPSESNSTGDLSMGYDEALKPVAVMSIGLTSISLGALAEGTRRFMVYQRDAR